MHTSSMSAGHELQALLMDPLIDATVIQETFLVLVVALILTSLGLVLVIRASHRHKRQAKQFMLRSRRAQAVIQAERESIRDALRDVGRDLHDNVGQLLTVAQLGMERFCDAPGEDPRLNDARHALALGIEEVRRLGKELHGRPWEQRTFTEAVESALQRLERVGRISAPLTITGTPPPLAPEVRTVLYRVFQEIVNDAFEHQAAYRIEVHIAQGPPFAITIAEQGNRSNDACVAEEVALKISRRCELIGFNAILTSAPGKGRSWYIHSQNDHGTS